jgi:serine/threonine protein kinase
VGAVAAAAASSSSSSQQSNILNFYRLSSSYLPLTSYHNHHQNHHQSNNMSNSAFMGIQCTCGASDLNNSKRPNSASSPIILPDEEEEEEEDEDDDDDDDEDEDEDDELDVEDEIEEIEIMTKSLNVITSSLNSNNNNNSSHKKFNSNNSTIKTVITPSTPTTINRNYKIIKPSESSTTTNAKDSYCGDTIRLNTQLQRASGTSSCHHTARIDMRRVRSFRDLTQSQLIFSPHDFLIEEKLGEGFFANVKKIVSKESRQEMVLKELKISCAPPPAPPPPPPPPAATTTTTTDTTDSSSCSSLLETAPKLDLLLNYAELNAAHKSFLKEAQVLRNLSHPNVIKFMGIMFTKEKHLNLILEYISGGTLKDIIHNISNVLPWKMRVGYAQDIAAAMEYLYSLNIIHRDLKSDNCLVRENGRTVVVADFGLSRICNYSNNTTTTTSRNNNNNSLSYLSIKNSDAAANSSSASSSLHKIQTSLISNLITQSPQSSSATNSFIVAAKRKLKRRGDNHHQQQQRRQQRYAVVGNSFSMAPEMLKHQIYDERVDIFSFGIICCEIIGRVQADPDYLPRTSDFGLNVELFRKKYCEADCPKHFIKIAIACCELEPEKRPPFSKTHLWLETILAHLEANNPIPKNLLKNILDQNNTKRPLSNNILGDLLPKI